MQAKAMCIDKKTNQENNRITLSPQMFQTECISGPPTANNTPRPALSRLAHAGNPLKCDCEIQWLRDWLGELHELRDAPTARAQGELREPICYYPQAMRGVPMLRTRENEFSCER